MNPVAVTPTTSFIPPLWPQLATRTLPQDVTSLQQATYSPAVALLPVSSAHQLPFSKSNGHHSPRAPAINDVTSLQQAAYAPAVALLPVSSQQQLSQQSPAAATTNDLTSLQPTAYSVPSVSPACSSLQPQLTQLPSTTTSLPYISSYQVNHQQQGLANYAPVVKARVLSVGHSSEPMSMASLQASSQSLARTFVSSPPVPQSFVEARAGALPSVAEAGTLSSETAPPIFVVFPPSDMRAEISRLVSEGSRAKDDDIVCCTVAQDKFVQVGVVVPELEPLSPDLKAVSLGQYCGSDAKENSNTMQLNSRVGVEMDFVVSQEGCSKTENDFIAQSTVVQDQPSHVGTIPAFEIGTAQLPPRAHFCGADAIEGPVVQPSRGLVERATEVMVSHAGDSKADSDVIAHNTAAQDQPSHIGNNPAFEIGPPRAHFCGADGMVNTVSVVQPSRSLAEWAAEVTASHTVYPKGEVLATDTKTNAAKIVQPSRNLIERGTEVMVTQGAYPNAESDGVAHCTVPQDKTVQAVVSAVQYPPVQPPVQATVERGTEILVPPWVQEANTKIRRTRLGLDDPVVHAFCQQCEFVSLGNYCGVAFALQALGLKRYSYPFDWVRSPAAGVIRCVQTNFANFLSHSFVRDQSPYPIQMFGGATWGGSFWHHRIQEDKVREDFTRRINRFYSRVAEVPASMPRVFVRVANSSHELGASADLLQALRASLPGSKVHLLVLIDLQKTQGLVHVDSCAGMGLLFYRLHESLYTNRDMDHTERMRVNGEAYAVGIASAIHLWAGKTGIPVCRVPNLEYLEAAGEPFQGGCPSSALYSPRSLPRTVSVSTPVVPSFFKGVMQTSASQAHVSAGVGANSELNHIRREASAQVAESSFCTVSVDETSSQLSRSHDEQWITHGSYVSDVSTSASSMVGSHVPTSAKMAAERSGPCQLRQPSSIRFKYF